LSSLSDTTVETWLKQTNYPEWKKVELLETYRKMMEGGGIRSKSKYVQLKCFGKRESYPDWKHFRGINSRSDEFKTVVGPIFRLIEKAVFQREEFIKKVPVADRPQYIRDRLQREGGKYFATDYSSFEALFTKEIMEVCEFQLYEYMTQDLPDASWWWPLILETLGGRNICKYKRFMVELDATRMSGEMCTSLGNGFSNLMFMLFMCEEKGCTNVVGVVEGDDGLFAMLGEPPTESDFAELGLIIKAECFQELAQASFCGLVFDPEDLVNVADVRKVLVGFGWTDFQAYGLAKQSKLNHLMRTKALSLVHQYPGCPILQSFGRAVLRNTRHLGKVQTSIAIARKTAGWWERERFDELLEALGRESWEDKVREVPINTRFLVEKLYGVCVETQLALEKEFDGWTELRTFDLRGLVGVPRSWSEYWRDYVQEWPVDDCCRPPPRWPRRADFIHPLDPVLDQ